MKTVLLTGASGFIGSHIASAAIKKGYKVIATRRNQSSLWRCNSFISQIKWVNVCDLGWKDEILQHDLSFTIHAAWNGVHWDDRQNMKLQVENLMFLADILDISNIGKVKGFIGIGSQAEYGRVSDTVDESMDANPGSTYGIGKLLAMSMVKNYCVANEIPWVWGRVFSCFGEMDDEKWLIPSLIISGLQKRRMELTLCEQSYDYIYINDLVEMILRVIESPTVISGVFNLSTGMARTLKSIVDAIAEKIGSTEEFIIGAMPYRANQSMFVEGNQLKFINKYGNVRQTDFHESLGRTINYYQSVLQSNESF